MQQPAVAAGVHAGGQVDLVGVLRIHRETQDAELLESVAGCGCWQSRAVAASSCRHWWFCRVRRCPCGRRSCFDARGRRRSHRRTRRRRCWRFASRTLAPPEGGDPQALDDVMMAKHFMERLPSRSTEQSWSRFRQSNECDSSRRFTAFEVSLQSNQQAISHFARPCR